MILDRIDEIFTIWLSALGETQESANGESVESPNVPASRPLSYPATTTITASIDGFVSHAGCPCPSSSSASSSPIVSVSSAFSSSSQNSRAPSSLFGWSGAGAGGSQPSDASSTAWDTVHGGYSGMYEDDVDDDAVTSSLPSPELCTWDDLDDWSGEQGSEAAVADASRQGEELQHFHHPQQHGSTATSMCSSSDRGGSDGRVYGGVAWGAERVMDADVVLSTVNPGPHHFPDPSSYSSQSTLMRVHAPTGHTASHDPHNNLFWVSNDSNDERSCISRPRHDHRTLTRINESNDDHDNDHNLSFDDSSDVYWDGNEYDDDSAPIRPGWGGEVEGNPEVKRLTNVGG